MTLTEFLLARIAEDEIEARQWQERQVRWPSRRVLAKCEADRLVVRFLSDLERGEFGDTMTSSLAYSTLCRMAVPYVDHPDFNDDWRP